MTGVSGERTAGLRPRCRSLPRVVGRVRVRDRSDVPDHRPLRPGARGRTRAGELDRRASRRHRLGAAGDHGLDARGGARGRRGPGARRRPDRGVRLARDLSRPGAGFAAFGLLAWRGGDHADVEDQREPAQTGAMLADAGIGLLFGALVGALFLSVLLLIPGWGYSPIRGALIVKRAAAGKPRLRPAFTSARGLGRDDRRCRACRARAACPRAPATHRRHPAAVRTCPLRCGARPGAAGTLANRALRDGPVAKCAAHDRRPPSRPRRLARTGCAPALEPPPGRPPTTRSCRRRRSSSTRRSGCRRRSPSRSISAVRSGTRKPATCRTFARRFNAHGARRDPALAQARDQLVGTVGETAARAFPLVVHALCGVCRRRVRGRAVRPPAASVKRAIAALVCAALALIAVEVVLLANLVALADRASVRCARSLPRARGGCGDTAASCSTASRGPAVRSA